MAAGGRLLLCAVSADDALADRHGLVELGEVHLIIAVVLHQALELMTPQDFARQIRRPRLTKVTVFTSRLETTNQSSFISGTRHIAHTKQ